LITSPRVYNIFFPSVFDVFPDASIVPHRLIVFKIRPLDLFDFRVLELLLVAEECRCFPGGIPEAAARVPPFFADNLPDQSFKLTLRLSCSVFLLHTPRHRVPETFQVLDPCADTVDPSECSSASSCLVRLGIHNAYEFSPGFLGLPTFFFFFTCADIHHSVFFSPTPSKSLCEQESLSSFLDNTSTKFLLFPWLLAGSRTGLIPPLIYLYSPCSLPTDRNVLVSRFQSRVHPFPLFPVFARLSSHLDGFQDDSGTSPPPIRWLSPFSMCVSSLFG